MILEGTDPSKGNAQAARCTGRANCAAREYARPPGGVTNRGLVVGRFVPKPPKASSRGALGTTRPTVVEPQYFIAASINSCRHLPDRVE